MQGYEVKFNIFAESQEEADAVAQHFKDLVNEYARSGIAVSAAKIQEAFRRWGNNPLVRSRINQFFK